jgi:molybdopterin molybdotransferase
MPEFLSLKPPLEALDKLLVNITARTGIVEMPTAAALGWVTAEQITAPYALPNFPRSTVDGYAVRAADTFGAGESLPAYLAVRGEVLMGSAASLSLDTAQCCLIHTGGMLPEGANAVVMVEHTQAARPDEVEVLKAVAVGDNVLHVGEDVSAGEAVILAGVKLRPAEIGGLMALGIDRVRVRRRPRVGIISSGDEIRPPGGTLSPGEVFDVNTYTLGALVTEAGGEPQSFGILPDQEDVLRAAAAEALERTDLLVLTAGSSVSTRDLTASVIGSLGEPGVLVHGVSVRPGKPTILGYCAGKPVIGLPGNPVSALVIAGLFVVPVIETLLGLERRRPSGTVAARLTLNLASQAGREDWVPVRLLPDRGGYRADPVFGKSNLIFTLARADGLVRIPPDDTGLDADEPVQVLLI